jgi:hypothetical protein
MTPAWSLSERHFDIEVVPLRLQRCYFLVLCKYIFYLINVYNLV